ncbi:ATP-grasp domain-containing protein [Pseudomonas sp. NPDC086581]|uniref:ATP-grasp domain-containing protein n=1 Tax=Pseudomonas sp. NPDC086581 TaxID=3364432 RepID=UPI00382DB92A
MNGPAGGFRFTCLVTAIGSYSAESVISSLREHWGARVVGTNTQPRNWCATSALLDTFHRVPAARNVTEYVERILRICEAEQVTHVVPLIDPEVDAFALHHEAFAERGITLCMQPLETIRVARDKWLVHQAFRNDALIRTIPTWRLEDLPVPGLDLPLIAKPRDGRNCEGLMQVRDADFLHYVRKRFSDRDYIVQPLLPGEVCVVDVVRQRSSGDWAAMARQELVRTPTGAGLTVRMLADPQLVEMAGQVARVLDVNGCINMEFLVQDGEALLMDVNPRFSGGIAFSHLSGYDMVANHLRCFREAPLDAPVLPAPSIHARRLVEVTTFAAPAAAPEAIVALPGSLGRGDRSASL